MNALQPADIIVRTDDTINAQSTLALYEAIEAQNTDKEVIYLICDNARYYKSKILQEKLESSKIKQLFLPAYSPNLNFIERWWKLMRQKVIDIYSYGKSEDLQQKLLAFFRHIAQYRQELDSLISWNFHIPRNKTNFY